MPVTLEIEPERVGVSGARPSAAAGPYVIMRQLVARGLRAQLKSGNLLTGELVVDLGFHPETPAAELRMDKGGHPAIPSVPAELEAITRSVHQVLGEIAASGIPELVADLRHAVQGIDRLVSAPETLGTLTALRQTAEATKVTLGHADTALQTMDRLAGVDSELRSGTVAMMEESTRAARAIRVLADYLERHPEALLRGKGDGY